MKPKSGYVIVRDYKLPGKDLVVTHAWNGKIEAMTALCKEGSVVQVIYGWSSKLENAKILKGRAGKKEAQQIVEEMKKHVLFEQKIQVAHVSWIKLNKKGGRIRCSASLNPRYRRRTE